MQTFKVKLHLNNHPHPNQTPLDTEITTANDEVDEVDVAEQVALLYNDHPMCVLGRSIWGHRAMKQGDFILVNEVNCMMNKDGRFIITATVEETT